MLRRQLVGLISAGLTISVLFCAFSVGIAGPQEKAKSQPPVAEIAKQKAKPGPKPSSGKAEIREAEITKMLADYDMKPHLEPTIPDDPPPHEGAMISLPYIVEPPDLVLVEVLEALPGRPISGERLVRPDGKISIGFYGDVYVKGLTLEQVKVAIIKQLRKFLTDENLGLSTPAFESPAEPSARPPIPKLPAGGSSPLDPEPEQKKAEAKPRSTSSTGPALPNARRASSPARQHFSTRKRSDSGQRRVIRVSSQNQEAPQPMSASIGTAGKVTITIEVHGPNAPEAREPEKIEKPENSMESDEAAWTLVPPANSDRVFVDITAYNSDNYFILGDILIPGKLPWTGNETVLDAVQFAGGLVASAEPKDIRLVRPGRAGKPAKIYKVDLAAIQDKGDVKSNYQILPNDRLIVGRNAVVEKTVAIDRLAAPIQDATSSIHNIANMLRAVQLVDQTNSGELLKELVDFWAKQVARNGDVEFDEKMLRDLLLKKLNPKTTPNK